MKVEPHFVAPFVSPVASLALAERDHCLALAHDPTRFLLPNSSTVRAAGTPAIVQKKAPSFPKALPQLSRCAVARLRRDVNVPARDWRARQKFRFPASA